MRSIAIPAEYANVDTTIVVTPASTREIEIPAVYKTVTKQVIDTPASSRTITIPAEYKSVSRRVVTTPASFREETVPAVYKTVSKQIVDTPASTRTIAIPAEFQTVTRNVKVTDDRSEWRPVLCDVNMTNANIRKLQTALKAVGCYECRIDGQIGPCTYRGVNQCYARKKGLPLTNDKYITLRVIQELGIELD